MILAILATIGMAILFMWEWLSLWSAEKKAHRRIEKELRFLVSLLAGENQVDMYLQAVHRQQKASIAVARRSLPTLAQFDNPAYRLQETAASLDGFDLEALARAARDVDELNRWIGGLNEGRYDEKEASAVYHDADVLNKRAIASLLMVFGSMGFAPLDVLEEAKRQIAKNKVLLDKLREVDELRPRPAPVGG